MTLNVGRRSIVAALVPVGCALLLMGLVLLATESLVTAILALGLATTLVLVVCFDLSGAGTLFVTLAMFLAPSNDLRLGSSYVTASDILFVVGFALLTPTILRNRLRVPPLFLLGLAIVLAMGSLASIAAPVPIVSANQLVRLIVGAFALPVFFMIWRPAQHVVVRFATAYIFGAVLSVGWAMLEGPIGEGRYIGLTYHPNYFGLASLLGLSLVPYVVAQIPAAYQWLIWGAGAICAFGVFISGSRAALLVMIMIFVIYPFVERSVRAGGAVMLGITGVLAFSGRLLSEDSDSNALGRLFGGGTASGSDLDRQRALAEAWDQFRVHPLLGNGFDGGLGSHNIYLQVAVAVGIFGLLGYLMIMWTALRPLFWPGINHRLAYPVLAYLAVGPLTNTLWDRLIWAAIALTFAMNTQPPPLDDAEDPKDSLAEMRNSG